MNLTWRSGSIALMLAIWIAASELATTRVLPTPEAVALAIIHEANSGALGFNLAITLLRVLVSFTIAMLLGTVIGLGMGRVSVINRFVDP